MTEAKLEQDKLGKILIELDLDTDKYNVGFSVPDTARLMKQVEVVNLFSPFHAACIINEIKRRREGQTIKPVHNLIIQ